MSAGGGRRRHKRGGHDDHEEHMDERWLVSFADMMTLMFALFMVLFSISSVNVSKFDDVRGSLQDAFSGQVLPGGDALRATGGAEPSERSAPEAPIPTLRTSTEGEASDARGRKEEEDFAELQRQIEQYSREHGLDAQVETEITRRGLVVRLLTDKILFASGEAVLKPEARPLMRKMAQLLKFEVRHPIFVEGHTDSIPIASRVYPTNWELSTGRAASVVRALIKDGVGRSRLGAAGYAAEHPVATNGTERGRRRNRRVEIVLTRQADAPKTTDQ
jgi:chemotaxis protein MotB